MPILIAHCSQVFEKATAPIVPPVDKYAMLTFSVSESVPIPGE